MKPGKSCSFFIRHKKRYCRLRAATGTEFCVHHLPEQDREKINRVPCPFNETHTVVSSGLQKHLSVCPDRPELVNQAPRINSVTGSALSLRSTCLPPIHSIADEIFRFIKKLETLDCRLGLNQCLSDLHVIQSDFVPVISVALRNPRHWSVNGFPGLLLNKFDNLTVADEQKTHTDLREPAKLVDSSVNVSIPDSHGSKRHIYQNGCLLNILKSEQLLSSEFAYVEFGAGRGGLSHWLNLCLSSEQCENPDALEKEVSWIAKPIDTNFILVELKSTRNKFDIRHRDAGNFIRLRMDIAQLKLNEVSVLKAKKKPIVAIAKHLCGDATDLALRCLKNAVTTTDSVGNKTRISGLMLAVCCHHQCSWEETVGRPWLERDAGVTAREFAIAARLPSWATCGFRVRQTDESRPVNNGVGKSNEEPSKAGHKATQPSPFACISPQKRTLIGRTCKRLIDWGRLCFVQNELQFTDAKLLPYTSTNVTAENVVMVARTDETNN